MVLFQLRSFALVALAMATTFGPLSCYGGVEAHGYVTISRANMCKGGENSNCGLIMYEPQSLEGPKGFPNSGPPDGRIASAGLSQFGELDQQSSSRWSKIAVEQGPFGFSWTFNANHRATGYQYYITKNGWNPNAPLSRNQFDLNPFCTVNGGGLQPPPSGVTHNCNLPPRSGYHVILAVWIVDDTPNAFYNVIDVSYTGTNAEPTASPPNGSTSSEGTCGGGNRGNGVCADSTLCCSQYGWCGTTADHCGGESPPPTDPTSSTSGGTCGGGNHGNGVCADPTLCCSQYGWCGTSADHCAGSSMEGTCGGGNRGNGVCADPTLCCSQYGWCGTSSAHCGAGRMLRG